MSSPKKKDQFTACQSCGVPWINHPGIVDTCKRNKQLEAALQSCRKSPRSSSSPPKKA